MKIKIISLSFILSAFTFLCKAQEDYFYTLKSYNIGSELIDGGQYRNSMVCQVRVGFGGIREYTPYEVSEYGFKNGRVYIARDIPEMDTVRRVFLERLAKGKINLYLFKGSNHSNYFVEIDSGILIPLGQSKRDPALYYKNKLATLTSDCDEVRKFVNLILYKQKSLASFADAYNRCNPLDFPYTKYGINFGYINTSLIAPPGVALDFLKGSRIKPDGSMTGSLFLEDPLGNKGLAMHYEIQFARSNFDYYKYDINQIYMVINTSYINLPVMLRYTIPLASSVFRPFIAAGGQLAFTMQHESNVMEDIMDGQVIISENLYSADLLAKKYAGYTAGAGIQFHVRHRMNIYAEFRYAMSYAVGQPAMLDRRDWFLLTGINF